MYYSKNCRKSKQLRGNCIFQARNHNNGYKPTRRFLPSPEWTVPEKSSKNRRVTTGHVLGNMVVFPTTECLAGSCIDWRASVGWIRFFSGQGGKPQHLNQRLTIYFLFFFLLYCSYNTDIFLSDIILLDWVLLGGSWWTGGGSKAYKMWIIYASKNVLNDYSQKRNSLLTKRNDLCINELYIYQVKKVNMAVSSFIHDL